LLVLSIEIESDITRLEPLVQGIVYQLAHASDPAAIIDSTRILHQKQHGGLRTSSIGMKKQSSHSSKVTIIRNILTSIAKQDSNLAMAAIALGSRLGTRTQVVTASSTTTTTTTTSSEHPNHRGRLDDWTQLVLQHCMTHFPTARECAMVRSLLQQATIITPIEWNDIILPAFVLKLKSHPDRALSTLLGWIEYVPSTALGASNDENNNNNNEWMTLLLKQITTSTKEENRETSGRILMTWTQKSSSSVAGAVAVALAESKPALAPARIRVYQVLETIAAKNYPNKNNETIIMENNNNNKPDPMTTTVIPKVLQGLLTLLQKEPKMEQRIPGLQAVVEWMIVAKRRNETTGYRKVLSELVQTPIRTKKAADAAVVLGILVQRVHPDLLGPMIVDIWTDGQQDKDWIGGIETLLNSAATKKSIVPESLIFVYLALVYAQQTAQPIPNWIAKLVSAGSSTKGGESSFLYSQTTNDLIGLNDIVSTIVPRIIAVYTQIVTAAAAAAADHRSPPLFVPDKMSLAIRILAVCVMSPRTSHTSGLDRSTNQVYASDAILGCIEIVLAQYPFVARLLVTAILEQVNDVSCKVESIMHDTNASRDARENDSNAAASNIKGQGSKTAPHCGFDSYSVRRVGRLLSGHCTDAASVAKVMILIHAGTSLKNDGHQRAALIWNTLNVIRKICDPTSFFECPEENATFRQSLADEILRVATSSSSSSPEHDNNADVKISWSLHEAALSLLLSLGGIACNFSPSTDDAESEDSRPYQFANQLCLENIARMLSSGLEKTFCRVETISMAEMELYQSPMGSLFRVEGQSVKEATKPSSKRLSEEEEWELQMKKELEEKKMSASQGSGTLSAEDKKLVEQQDNQRRQISSLLTVEFVRVLESIRHLCSSDIEVGNTCLPIISRAVLASSVSVCPAIQYSRNLQAKTLQVLTTLGTCVYEIHEDHAPTIAVALQLSCTLDQTSFDGDLEGRLRISSLPSPCAPAACVVFEMDQFQDVLSGASFFFLFPIIRAALMGPRTPPGCEAVLRVLDRHTAHLVGPLYDSTVSCIRREMASSILELLKHDRAQTFHDPTAFEALVACYQTKSSENGDFRLLSTAELAPLLDERGALGSKPCRLGSMIALTKIAEDQPKLIRADPLVENRIWFNCFEQDDEIRRNARRCWSIIHDAEASNDKMSDISTPSPLYAAPLLPLLSNPDSSIAQSAANAYAHAMGKHPSSVSRNIELLCKSFIDNFPSTVDGGSKNTQLASASKPKTTPILTAPKKITTGLPKKVAPKKSALEVAGISGIGKPKSAVKKKSSHAALLKPKQERTMDDETLANQFITGISTAKQQEKDSPAKIAARIGVLRVIVALCDNSIDVHMDETTLTLLTSFLMAYGIADGDNTVKGAARDGLRDLVAAKGGSSKAIAFLLPHLEDVLKTGMADENSLGSLSHEKVPKDSLAKDRRKEAAVVALGSVALHLKGAENDEKVESTVDMLTSALKTPSEEVQLSVADTLMKLMKKGRIEERIEIILSGLLKDCLNSENSALRRGAAHGLSAAIKGSGIGSLKKYDVVRQLEEACASGTSNNKEGALFAMELLSSRLGLLFEPYVIVLLPSLLKSFSDSSDHVRNAANDTAGLIMSRLSAHGVKLVMPAVIKAFEDPAWRTKAASINMLGAMSHLAPKQLAVSLPKIVPQLIEAYTDSTHAKVKAGADEALNQITTVVKNPEISSISGNLLAALKDPAHCTTKALEVLIQTEFLHAIDSPSLALIVPILHRGLRDRGATTKRFSALIAGNICTMINDPKDFVPYLPTLLPDLQVTLLDPIPDVRSTSAKALGSLTRGLGEHVFLELRPWLISKLREESCSSAERSGAAQGLTEVLIASGTSMVEDTMRSEILPLRNYPDASTREGVLWMLTFLPPAMGQGFTSLIDVSLPALISGLSDDSEPVREVALRAGRVLIRSHGKVHVDKILPSLEAGLGDDDYRIRVSSLSLLGDLLSMIGGTQVVKGEGDTQDDIRKAERAQAQIALVLGSETRKRVLSGLYLARSDSVHMVRQSAVQVWKTVVSATPRTLREILPVLVAKIIDVLASGHAEKTDVAGRCLGDLVSKLGDSVLPQIIPVLRNTLYNGDSYTKRGVCVGLTEVISCSTKDQILRFIEIIVKVLQTALSDDDDGVRNMAAASFQSLHSVVGSRALDEIVPSFLVALEEDDEVARRRALNGLTGILTVRSRELLPYIIPRLIKKPITSNHAEVLTGIAHVSGSTLHFHFSTIIPALLEELACIENDDEREQRIRTSSRAVCESIDTVGVNWLVSEIASKCGSDKPSLRRESCKMFEYFISERKLSLEYQN
jgi:hypothetical protein